MPFTAENETKTIFGQKTKMKDETNYCKVQTCEYTIQEKLFFNKQNG